MPEANNILKTKLDRFIRKYYLNRMLRGILLGAGGLLACFIFAAVAEYFGHFSIPVRTAIFFLFVVFALLVFLFFIAIPFLKSRKITGTISYAEASDLLGKYFPEISDKLLNTLQLQEQAEVNNSELLKASIQQRISIFSGFSFSSAINLKASVKKYGRFTLIPLALLLLLLGFQSSIITRPAERILSYNRHYVKEAPYAFVVLNKSLNAVRNSDLMLEVELRGNKIPTVLYVRIDDRNIRMEHSGKNRFSYTLYNLTRDYTLQFTDDEYASGLYRVKVLPDPGISSFEVRIVYPAYTGKKTEHLKNTGDFSVPQGSKVEWMFQTKDADNLHFNIDGRMIEARKEGQTFACSAVLKSSTEYYVIPRNAFVSRRDTIRYGIQVIQDRFPGIAAEQNADSINPYVYYFYGKADDDYGISKLNFAYREIDGKQVKYLPVEIGKSTDEIFYYMADLRNIGAEGREIEYYFEVWDNDAVNGRKSSRSQVFRMQLPDRAALKADAESSSTALKSKMSESMREIRELQRKSSELSKDIGENKQMDWSQQQKIQDFIEEQRKLEKKIEAIKKDNLNNAEKEKQLSPLEKELLDKQKELEKLFNEILSPEMKDLLKKLEESLKQQNKEAVRQELEKLNKSNEDMKKQLDRSLEQFKQLEIEKRISEEVKELRKLSEEQKALSEKTAEKTESKEALQRQQDEINKKYEALKKELEQTEQKNKQLESPMKLDALEQDKKSLENSLKESSESLEKKQNKKAAGKQKESADKMEEMAEKLEKSLEKAQEEQEEEDYYALRQLLENLIELSVQQESLLGNMKALNAYSPKFVEISAMQRKLKEVSKMVEDSLLALSKRQIQIKSFVNKEIGNINGNMDAALDHFSRVQIQGGVVRQQYVMTGLNNLAVMLSEALKNMQESMKEKKEKKQGQCNNPGGGKPGKPGNSGKPKMGGLKQQQDDINKMLQEMKQGKQQGKSPGSEQFAKMAARQEALRREVERLQKMLKEEGKPGSMGDLERTRQLMEQQERDLVNKQISAETIRRMEEIKTRMLEHEKAEREQENDNQREAEKANEPKNEMPPAIKAYLEKKAKEMELLRSVPNELTPYYKDRVRIYFQKVGTR